MNTLKKEVHCSFIIAFSLISLIGLTDLVCALSFASHFSLSFWHFPLSVGLTLVLTHYFIKQLNINNTRAAFFKCSGLLLFSIIAAIVIAGCFYDLSFDGQGYHQEAVYQMGHNHWNPFYEKLPDSVNQAIWVNHYPKQSETGAAVIYALTGKIETGKAFNILLLIASFCLTYSFLKQYIGFSNSKAFFISLLFAFNPIAIHQVLTYLVDGQMASLLLCLLICCLWLYHDASWDKLLLFVFIIIACINIKLTAIAFTGIFIIFLLLLLLLKKQFRAFWRIFTAAAISTLIAVIIVGFNPYVINTARYHNTFYPLFGEHPVDIMTKNSPAGFSAKEPVRKNVHYHIFAYR